VPPATGKARGVVVDVALTPRDLAGADLRERCALVVDVLRASTSIVTALDHGCPRVIPVGTAAEARARARALNGTVLLGGERGGERIPGFDLGNSPLEYTAGRVRGRPVVLTTTNGTRALLAAQTASETAVAAFVNADAAARWAASRHRDVVVVCAGERDAVALEDVAAAGVVVEHLARLRARVRLTDAAIVACGVGERYRANLGRLRADAAWARRLAGKGYEADLAACLSLATSRQVPWLVDGALIPFDNDAARPSRRAGA
jgi:2-phosphosulfolactate phosphatase